ncbi:MAG TPA: glycosyltransferase family 4 protein [Candidatus Limnocylindria bacterium]|nr:glycosyltransferase family 4 protein [Candidatus Limnocylindria bacterium]
MDASERISLVLAESGTAVGGTERVVWELATRLPAARFDVQVWLSPVAGVDELAESLAARGIAVQRVAEVDSRWDWRGMLATWTRLRRARPTLLHVHHVWPAADRYLTVLARAAGVSHLVVTEHIIGRSHSDPQRSLKRQELSQVDAVTAVCGAVVDSLVHDYGLERNRVRVVPNGADLPDEQEEWPVARRLRDQFGAGAFKPLWVCPARLEEQKGHAVLLEALADVRRRGLEFVVGLAGEGSLRESLERRSADLGLGPYVRFLGQVDAIGPLLLAADACVLPSLWEGLPLSLLEALARARPTIATRVGGVPEVVQDGVSGRLVPPGDAGALADALEEFHRKPDPARRMGVAGAERVRAEYTWERVVAGFEAVYDDVLGLASFTPAAGAERGRRR